MTDLIIQTEADLAVASTTALLGLTFTKSSSASYALAVEIAKTAQRYAQKDYGGKPVHFVLFGRSREEAIKARSLLAYVGKWKGSQIYAGGKAIQNWYQIQTVLECYLTSTSLPDPKAHCHVILPAFQATRLGLHGQELEFPCRYMANWTGFDLDPRKSVPMEEQFRAAAVRRGCDWCPNFNVKS